MKIILGVLALFVVLLVVMTNRSDPAVVDPQEIDAAIRSSDDFDRYQAAFHSAARRLIEGRNCTLPRTCRTASISMLRPAASGSEANQAQLPRHPDRCLPSRQRGRIDGGASAPSAAADGSTG
jgi:hypothetical protein